MNRKHYESVDFLKVLLLILIIISSYTLVNTTGVPVLSILSFCVGTFYLLFGYFVLRDGEGFTERIKRSIRHTAIAFVIAAVVYFALLCAMTLFLGGRVADFFTKRAIFEFIVLNAWAPTLGGNIWIIHAALYALIIFYFLHKWGLLRYDLHIMIVLFIIATLLGEGAGLIGFNLFGYRYIPGNFLTRAMPYMLLGRILYKARSRGKLRKIKNWMWVVIFLVGIAMTFIEINALISAGKLVYLNHLIGFIPMSAAAAMFFLNIKRKLRFGKYYADIGNAGFYLYSVVAQAIYLIISSYSSDASVTLYALLGLFTAVVTLALAIVYARLKNGKAKKTGDHAAAEDAPESEAEDEDLESEEGTDEATL